MKQFGILGYPLKHTMSPILHKKLAACLGEEISYVIQEIAPHNLSDAMDGLMALNGFNVTIPYKRQIEKYLDGLDESAKKHGAVNVVAGTEGERIGYNTDCIGFVRCMEGAGISISGRVCIVGLGGAGRMFATECAIHSCELTIAVRKTHLEAMAQDQLMQADWLQLKSNLESLSKKSVSLVCVDELEGKFDLLIQASPVGMFPNTDASPIHRDALRTIDTVFDCIYNPQETKLLREAKAMGCRVCGGMAMLVWQAAAAQEIWLRKSFSQEQIKTILHEMEEAL